MENIAFLKPLLSSELKIIKMLKCLKYHLCPGLNITVKPVLRWPNTVFTPTSFPGLFQDSDWFFQGSKIHINPLTPKISVLVLLTVCHTFQIFYLSLTDFQNFPGPVAFFQDFPVLVNATTKFQDFPGFPGPVQTLFHEWFSWCNSARAQGLEKTNMPSIEQFSDHFIYSTPALSVLFFSKFERSVLMALVFY